MASIKDITPFLLSIAFLIIYSVIQFYAALHPSTQVDLISARAQDILLLIMSYWFGASHQRKIDGA